MNFELIISLYRIIDETIWMENLPIAVAPTHMLYIYI
jgi:hypothetical protein